MTLCPVSNKAQFSTRGNALRAAKKMERQHKGLPSVYFCPHCSSWHLTHYSYRLCHDFPREKKEKKKKDMRIFIDTQDQGAVMVDTYQPPHEERRGILLALTKEPSPIAVGLSYDQACELVEALKIQIAKV